MSEPKEVLFTVSASIDGDPIGGRYSFIATDIQDFTEFCEGEVYEYADRVFDEVETHECY